jgi:hypothetical protein
LQPKAHRIILCMMHPLLRYSCDPCRKRYRNWSMLAWYGAEAALARAFGWPLRARSPLFWVARDLLLPVLWLRGSAVDVRATAPATDAQSAMLLP